MELVNGLALIAIVVAVTVGLFVVLREVVLWYFRLGEIADNLKVIADHYRALAAMPPQDGLNAPKDNRAPDIHRIP